MTKRPYKSNVEEAKVSLVHGFRDSDHCWFHLIALGPRKAEHHRRVWQSKAVQELESRKQREFHSRDKT